MTQAPLCALYAESSTIHFLPDLFLTWEQSTAPHTPLPHMDAYLGYCHQLHITARAPLRYHCMNPWTRPTKSPHLDRQRISTYSNAVISSVSLKHEWLGPQGPLQRKKSPFLLISFLLHEPPNLSCSSLVNCLLNNPMFYSTNLSARPKQQVRPTSLSSKQTTIETVTPDRWHHDLSYMKTIWTACVL